MTFLKFSQNQKRSLIFEHLNAVWKELLFHRHRASPRFYTAKINRYRNAMSA